MKPVVVFLHGLARTHRSLSGLRRHVARRGYKTWSRTYPSRRAPVADLAAELAATIRADLGDQPVIGVTHSLGGVLARHMVGMLPWQGVVMLAPPNSGSRVAAALSEQPLFRWVFGPAMHNLANPNGWPLPPSPFAVIAGTRRRSVGNPPSWLIGAMNLIPASEPNDGTLTVEETRLDGMADFALVDASHTWLMNHPATRRLVVHFVEHGRFPTAASALK